MSRDITKHLDLGCGRLPRNPYQQDKVYGIDIRENLAHNIFYANLSIQPIPFECDFFDSVSAYDFLEHIPRVAVDFQNATTTFPFIKLLNEIDRVLKLGGKFYASTPCFPNGAAFVDPTHVNFITESSHDYFIGTDPTARMYGFTGNFKLIRGQLYRPRLTYEPKDPNFGHRIKIVKDIIKRRRSHMIWEFQKIPPQA